MEEHTHAVSATLLFTPKSARHAKRVLDRIVSALNDAGEALDDDAGVIVAQNIRSAGSVENEVVRLNGSDAKEPWVLLTGDPRGGLNVIGPFADFTSCEDYPSGWEDSDWWPTKLRAPEEWRTRAV